MRAQLFDVISIPSLAGYQHTAVILTLRLSRNALARKVAYVAQKNELTNATVFDCVLLGRTPYIKWAISQKDLDLCEEVIEQLGISHLKLRDVDQLSGGEMQKVMLARALVQQPELLLLDEPTSNLDPKNQYEMMALVQKIAREKNIAVLIVIHDLNLALRYCDKFYFIKDHVGYSYGGIETVTSKTIETVYVPREETTRKELEGALVEVAWDYYLNGVFQYTRYCVVSE